MIAVSWFKKYTIANIFAVDDRKYFLKECFILSAFGVACFGVNKITLWPVTFSLFLLPITVFLFEVVIGRAREGEEEKQGPEVENIAMQVEIQVEAV